MSARPVVTSYMLERYDREQLYEDVWKSPMRKLAEEWGVSSSTLSQRCRNLGIPVPGVGYWEKKAAGKPVSPRPPLPAIEIRQHGRRLNEGSSPSEQLKVSRLLNARYSREELYQDVWKKPLSELTEKYGKSNSDLSQLCKKLHIPVPSIGYWNKLAANRPVESRPPLPEVKVVAMAPAPTPTL